MSDPKRGGAEFGSDSERSPNYDIIYSIPKTETITWFICFNQCMGLFLFLFFSYKNYTFIYLVYLFLLFYFYFSFFKYLW